MSGCEYVLVCVCVCLDTSDAVGPKNGTYLVITLGNCPVYYNSVLVKLIVVIWETVS